MQPERRPPVSDDSEEARAFLQARVTLFWKVMFFITLFGNGLGAIGAVAQRGMDFWVTLAVTAQAGTFWWVCGRGQRSAEFSRLMETAGLVLYAGGGASVGRFLLVGVTRDHSLAQPTAIMMADAYVAMLQLFGTGLAAVIRAALIPSQPRRTLVLTSVFGLPAIVVTSFSLPTAGGSLVLRALDSEVLPWLPVTMVVMWTFVVITSTLISKAIYGLRAEVREARRLGQYVLEQKIGEGGMGEVYRARHGMMRRPSAIKLMRANQASEAQLRRFEREVQLTARLTHPNTITIFDYGRTHDGVFYYAMELLDGANLQRIVSLGGPQPAGRVVRILTMVCGALTEAHNIGLIHRDIKPANIMLCAQGGELDVVKLLDFGLVKELVVDAEAELTGVSTLIGTPQYMAPESILGPGGTDTRSDIYALGAVAYFLLAGVDVFDGKSVIELCIQHLHQPPTPFAQRGVQVPAELEAMVLACLDKQPERRPQSAAELRRRLEACNVTPWDAEDAQAWWQKHQDKLAQDPTPAVGAARTLSRATTFVAALALALASSLFARHSAAQDAPEAIAWTYRAPPECPPAEAFEREFQARTKRARLVTDPDNATRGFVVTLSSEPGRTVGRIEIDGPAGAVSKRVVAGHTCGGVVSALALVAALAVDPLAAEAPPSSPPDAPVARASPEPLPVKAPDHDRASTSRTVVASGLAGGGVVGLFPDPAPSVSTFIEVGRERGSALSPSARLSLSASASSSVSVSPGSASFRWMAATLDGCPLELRWAKGWRATPCAFVQLGVLAGSGRGVATPEAESRRWIALGGSARLNWNFLGAFFAEAQGRLEAPLARDTFVFALPERVVVHAIPAVLGSFELGAGVRWP